MSKTAVVTGGSGGIGLHAARLLAQNGYTVFELSRSGKSEDGVIHIDTDVSKEESVGAAFAQIVNRTDKIDVLVSNAGMGISGAAEFTCLSEAKRLFDVNFFGMVSVINHAMPLLKAAKGRIVAVSSAAAVLPVPFQAFYSASKAAINSYCFALTNEIGRFGVSVTVVMPGDVQTGFTAARAKSSEGEHEYGGAIARSVALMEHDEQSGMTPLYAAKHVYKAAASRRAKAATTVGPKYKAFVLIAKLLPAKLVNGLIGGIYAK